MVRIECVCVYVYLFIHFIYMFGCIRTHTYMYTLESIYTLSGICLSDFCYHPSRATAETRTNELLAVCGVCAESFQVPTTQIAHLVPGLALYLPVVTLAVNDDFVSPTHIRFGLSLCRPPTRTQKKNRSTSSDRNI